MSFDLKNKELVIAGLARDCAHSLPRLLEVFRGLGAHFERRHYIFLENDSLDQTRPILKQFAKQEAACHFKTFPKLSRTHAKRTDRLAFLRNHIVDLAFDKVDRPDEAFLLLLDLDGANADVDTARILGHIARFDGRWAGLFANQSDIYYDLWAFRHPTLCPYDIWEKVRNRPDRMSYEEALDAYIEPVRRRFDPDMGLVNVDSAFGGLGLYHLGSVAGCRYKGLDEEDEEICEHVAFNLDIGAKGGQLFIDTGLINGTGLETHVIPLTRLQKFRKKLRRILQR